MQNKKLLSETVHYDVIVIGGGIIGLSAAYESAVRRSKKTLVLEQFSFGNQKGSSPGYGRQFRICYPQNYLTKLAISAGHAWDELASASGANLVRKTGTLWFGDPTAQNAEGNIPDAIKQLEACKEPFYYIDNAHDIQKQFPWLTIPKTSEKTIALYVANGGTVDLQLTVQTYLNQLWDSNTAVLHDNTEVVKIKVKECGVTVVATHKGVQRKFKGAKIILTPGVYVNNVLQTIVGFDKIINLDIFKWASTYFNLKKDENDSSVISPIGGRLQTHSTYDIPTWIYFGKPQEDEDEDGGDDESKPQNHNSFYGFPSERRDHHGDLIRVAPDFASNNKFVYSDFIPKEDLEKLKKPRTDEIPGVDKHALKFAAEWVHQFMHTKVDHELTGETSSCYACFAKLTDPKAEDPYGNGQGFVLDYIPNTHNKIALFTGGWAGKFVPLFGRILVDLIEKDKKSLPYFDLIEPFDINRGILKKADEKCPLPKGRHRRVFLRCRH